MIRNGNKKREQQTARPSKYPQGKFRNKPCKFCGKEFELMAPSQFYCSQGCIDDANADRYYKANYGVGILHVRGLLEEQNGVCAICKTTGFKMLSGHYSGLNLDHCHSTGKVRGLLCHNCNRGLGLFKDSADCLKEAIRYLERE